MLRHQAAENSVITSGAAKNVLFSSIDNCNCWILKQFERTSYFLGIQAWVLRQNGKQKRYAQKSGQRSTFSFLISLFFIIGQNACLNFFETAFELLLYRRYFNGPLKCCGCYIRSATKFIFAIYIFLKGLE